jgi:acyl carrier protein
MDKTVLKILKEIQPDYDFEADVNFVEMGYLDSFDVVTLVGELEETFSIVISALDIVPENFASLKNICGLIQRSKTPKR